MKRKNIKLEWYVLRHTFNADKIIYYNVLGEWIVEEIYKEIKKKNITNYTELKEFIRKEFMYYYWCKAEHEIMVGGLFTEEANLTKIDIYSQLEPNLDRITEYIINAMEIKF